MPTLLFPATGETLAALPVLPLDPFFGGGQDKLYVRLLGCNGAGKSTFGRYLRVNDPEAFTFLGEDGKTRLGTIFPRFGWGAVGLYVGKGGGADRLTTKEHRAEALYRLVNTRLHVLIEGMAVTNTREGFWQIDLGIQANFGRKALLIHLDYPLEECLRRIYARNGGKAINESYVIEIYRRVHKTVRLYRERIAAGAPVTLYSESTLGPEAMVESLLGMMREVYGSDVLQNGSLPLRG